MTMLINKSDDGYKEVQEKSEPIDSKDIALFRSIHNVEGEESDDLMVSLYF